MAVWCGVAKGRAAPLRQGILKVGCHPTYGGKCQVCCGHDQQGVFQRVVNSTQEKMESIFTLTPPETGVSLLMAAKN